MSRNRCNRVPYPAPNTKINGKETRAKIKTTQAKSQRDSSFPADGHKAILNKMNNKSKTNNKRTNTDN